MRRRIQEHEFSARILEIRAEDWGDLQVRGLVAVEPIIRPEQLVRLSLDLPGGAGDATDEAGSRPAREPGR